MRIMLGLGAPARASAAADAHELGCRDAAARANDSRLGGMVTKQARTSGADAHNARVEATQPSPETSQLMCIMLGLGAIARTSAADALMLGFSGATVRDSDAQSPTRGEPAPPMLIMLMFYVWFRGYPTIARTSTADGHYTRLGRRVP